MHTAGLPEAKYEHLNAVLTALKEGGPIPAAAPLSAAPVAAAAAPAAAPAGTSAAGEVAADGAAAPAAPKQGGNPVRPLESSNGVTLWRRVAFFARDIL